MSKGTNKGEKILVPVISQHPLCPGKGWKIGVFPSTRAIDILSTVSKMLQVHIDTLQCFFFKETKEFPMENFEKILPHYTAAIESNMKQVHIVVKQRYSNKSEPSISKLAELDKRLSHSHTQVNHKGTGNAGNIKDFQALTKKLAQQKECLEEYKKKLIQAPEKKKNFYQRRIGTIEASIQDVEDQILALRSTNDKNSNLRGIEALGSSDDRWKTSIETDFESTPSLESQVLFTSEISAAISNLHAKMKTGTQRTFFGQLVELLESPVGNFYSKAVQFVEELCSLRHNRRIIFQTQVLPACLHLLEKGDNDTQSTILLLIAQASSFEEVKHALLRANVIPIFLRVIKEENNCRLQRPSFAILSNLLLSSVDELRPLFRHERANSIFIDVFIHYQNNEIQQVCLHLISLIGLEVDDKKRIIKSGMIPVLMSFVESQNNLAICKLCVGTLSRVAESPEALEQIATEKGLLSLGVMMQLPDATILYKVLEIIRALCDHRRFSKMLSHSDLLHPLLYLMKYNDPRIIIPTLACVPYLVASESSLKSFVLYGGLQSIALALETSEMKRAALVALVKLTSRPSFHLHSKEVAESHMVLLLAKSVRSQNVNIQHLALQVLVRISYGTSGPFLEQEVDSTQLLSVLLDILPTSSKLAQRTILVTLQNLVLFSQKVEVSDVLLLKYVIQLATNSPVPQGDDSDFSPVLNASMISISLMGPILKDNDIQEQACLLLCDLALRMPFRALIVTLLTKSLRKLDCEPHNDEWILLQQILNIPLTFDPLVDSGGQMTPVEYEKAVDAAVCYMTRQIMQRQIAPQLLQRRLLVKASKEHAEEMLQLLFNEDSQSNHSLSIESRVFESSTDCEENLLTPAPTGEMMLLPGFRSTDEIKAEEKEIQQAKKLLQVRMDARMQFVKGISRSRRSQSKDTSSEELRCLAKQMTLHDLHTIQPKREIETDNESVMDSSSEKREELSDSQDSTSHTAEKEENRIFAEQYAMLNRKLSNLKKEKAQQQEAVAQLETQSSLHDHFHHLNLPSTSNSNKERYLLLFLLLSYEKTYFSILDGVTRKYYLPLVKCSAYPGSTATILPCKKIHKIFGNLIERVRLHFLIVERLRENLKYCSPSFCLGDLYLSMMPLLERCYENPPELKSSLSCLSKVLRSREKMKEYHEMMGESKELWNGVIMPAVYIPTLVFYLKQILSRTKRLHPDYQKLNGVVKKLTKLQAAKASQSASKSVEAC